MSDHINENELTQWKIINETLIRYNGNAETVSIPYSVTENENNAFFV